MKINAVQNILLCYHVFYYVSCFQYKLKKKLFNIYVLGGTWSGIYVVDVYRAIEMFSF